MKKIICFIVAAIVVSSISLSLSQKSQASSIINELRQNDITAVTQDEIILVTVCYVGGDNGEGSGQPFYHRCVGNYPDVKNEGITTECKVANGYATLVAPKRCYLTPRYN